VPLHGSLYLAQLDLENPFEHIVSLRRFEVVYFKTAHPGKDNLGNLPPLQEDLWTVPQD